MNFSLQQMAAALGGEVRGREVLAPGPGHSHKDRSLAIRLDPRAPDGFVVHSFSGDDPLASKDYVRDKLGIRWEPKQRGSSSASIARMQDRVSGQSVERPQVAEYIYKMEDGTPYLRVKRTPDKQFYQSHWTGSSWMNGAPKGPKIPYRLPEIREAEHETVLIVEGEKMPTIWPLAASWLLRMPGVPKSGLKTSPITSEVGPSISCPTKISLESVTQPK
jgi:hypothetical protein